VTEYEIRAGEYSAVVTAQGAALRLLQFRGRDLVVPFPEGGPIPDYRGIIAAPWPNRIADGKYTFEGVEYRLPTNEVERDCALHGLVFGNDWTLKTRDESSIVLTCLVRATAGYPFTLGLIARYRVDGDGLHTSVAATNIGAKTAPYGVCPHPYLIAGPASLDEWTLEIPAGEFLDVTPDRLLPVALRTIVDHEFDFRTPRMIGAAKIDHAFTNIASDGDGRSRMVIRDPGGTGVGMEWDRSCPWLQIHTADKEHPSPNRLGLAVEPMTCPPDAFNSGQNLVRLKPGESHEAAWRIHSV
jgi:aldose 1-epimerase